MNGTLSLSQKLFLLAIKPRNGGIDSSASGKLNFTLIGGLLMELHQNKNIAFENKRIVVLKTDADTEIHRFLINKIASVKKPRKISYWLNKLSMSARKIRKAVTGGLETKYVVRMEPKRFLFFKWEKPFLTDKTVVYKLISEIERQIFNGVTNEDDILLLSFLQPAGLLRRLFPDRRKRKIAEKKLKQMIAENQMSEAVSQAIAAAATVAASVAVSGAITAGAH